MKTNRLLGAVIFLAGAVLSGLGQDASGLKDAAVLIIRHAEKPPSGPDLTPAGYERADAYVKYFGDFQVDGQPLKPDCLFAAADTKNSRRPRLTLEPLSRALHLPLNTQFKDKAPELLADELKSKPHGKVILVCWRHGQIPGLIRALGGDPDALLPGGQWPAEQFGWVIALRYDGEGKLKAGQSRRIEEGLTLKAVPKQE